LSFLLLLINNKTLLNKDFHPSKRIQINKFVDKYSLLIIISKRCYYRIVDKYIYIGMVNKKDIDSNNILEKTTFSYLFKKITYSYLFKKRDMNILKLLKI